MLKDALKMMWEHFLYCGNTVHLNWPLFISVCVCERENVNKTHGDCVSLSCENVRIPNLERI